jgi:hypothetical protein
VLPLARLLLPDTTEVVLPGMGRMGLGLTFLDEDVGAGVREQSATVESFSVGEGAGLFLMDRLLARQLVDRLLGRVPSVVPTPLSRIERGLLCGLIAVWSGKLGLCLGLGSSAPGLVETAGEVVRIDLAIFSDGLVGRARICAGREWVERCWRSQRRWSEPSLALLRLELAQTVVPRAEALAVVAGDVIVFDETRALSPAGIALRLCHGGRKVGVRLAPDGRLCLDQPGETTEPVLPRDPTRTDVVEVVEISAEIGHWTGGADDGPPLIDEPPSEDWPLSCDRVLLRMAGQDWAEGTSCALDGRLGVRVTRLFAG